MIDIHKSGKDFHTMVASMVSGKPYDKIDKATRYIYKWTNWTLLYGGDAYTLSNMYGIPIKQAERSVAQYYDQFPEVLFFKDECEKFTVEHGYIESPFGRRELLPYIKDPSGEMRNRAIREAVNMPVQSGASDTLLIAMTIIDRLISTDYPAVLVNTVHDSVMLYVERDAVKEVAKLCVDIMENVIKWSKRHMPGIDFSWLICPLKADVDVGTHYGSLVPLEEWK
jgi:DNA polymerase-1